MKSFSPIYRHFVNLRKEIREDRIYHASHFYETPNPDWLTQVENKKKKTIHLCDLEQVFQSIGEVYGKTLPIIRNFGPTLNKLPKYYQQIKEYTISDIESEYGFEKINSFYSAKLKSNILYSGKIPVGTVAETTTVSQKGCRDTVIVENEEESNNEKQK